MNGSPVTLRFHVGRIDDSTGSPIVHRINDVDVDPAVVADVQTFVRWTWRELRRHEQRAELQRKRVDDLEAERDGLAGLLDRALADIGRAQRDRDDALSQTRAELANVERLRALLVEALDLAFAECMPQGPTPSTERLVGIRREAGLT